MYWHPSSDTVYLAHPRTASIATKTALMEQAGFRCVGSHHFGVEKNMGMAAHRGPEPERVGELWRFCVVRNHFDAVVSWCYGGGREADLPIGPAQVEAVVTEHATNYVAPGRLWPLADEADEVIRFERLPRALNDVLGMRGLEPVEIPRENVSSGRPHAGYRELISPEGREAIEERWSEEMSELGYGW